MPTPKGLFKYHTINRVGVRQMITFDHKWVGVGAVQRWARTDHAQGAHDHKGVEDGLPKNDKNRK